MLEGEIEALSEKVDEMQAELDASSAGYTELADLYDDVSKLNTEIEEKTERWMELAEKKERLEEEKRAAAAA